MFGKPHDDTDTLDSSAIDGFFGYEAATAKAVEVDELQHRVEQVEAQISSQFTSLATYAQIAQEQVELARSEARAATERSEQRVTSLIERERADRISSFTGQAPAGSAPDVSVRLDALEHSVAQIRKGLDECLQRQKSLAEAITVMFERFTPNDPATGGDAQDAAPAGADAQVEPTPAPVDGPTPTALEQPMPAPVIDHQARGPLSGPIADLSLEA